MSAEMGRSRHVVIHDVYGGTTKWAEAVTETNQLSGRGLVLVPGCAVHILGNWLILTCFTCSMQHRYFDNC